MLRIAVSFVTVLLIVFVASQGTDEIDLNDLIGAIINTTSTNAPMTTSTAAMQQQTCPSATSLCVPYYLCGDGTLSGNQLNLDDPDNPCHYLQKCCPFIDLHEDRIGVSSTEGNIPEPVMSSSVSPPTSRPLTILPATPSRCGIRNKDGLTYRIKNAHDHEAEFAEFPWMTAIFEEADVLGLKKNVYKCGGSLIHPRVVMTAAHCVNKKANFVARVGEWDTQTEHEIIPHQDRKVKDVVLHEGFYKGGLFNDIALLILESAFEPADNVGYVCLPKASGTFDSIQCTASGWGRHTLGGNEQTILKKVDLPVVPRASCLDIFRNLRKSPTYELHESYLCAGGFEGKDTCKGDGGSPLVCPTMRMDNQFVQAGIVSWGRGCGENNVPAVYSNVAALRDWIDLKMTERDLDTFHYEF